MINNTIDGNPTIPDDFELQKLTPGRTLCEKYRLENEAGVGGMGVVWKAWDLVAERPVALKFIPPEIRHSEAAMAQVKKVFQTVQALNHQNIGPIYGLEKDPTFGYFIVKKWLEGQTLDEMKLPPARIPDVLAKVADALDYAHSKRVMHRDVKPSNIFIETNGDVLLNDFGLAAEIQNSISLNTSSTVCRTSGTRPYMAPEQWKGQRQDGQTDQYALGVLAYQLYSGRLPFEIQDLLLLRLAVLQDIPEPIENVPDSVNAAILRALSKDRKNRFATCREFIDALTGTTLPASSVPAAPSPIPVPPNQPPAPKLPPTPRSSFEWDGTKITKFIGEETEVVIPEGVTEIGVGAFEECSSLTSVVIPKGVTRIGDWAFSDCSSLTSVVIPEGVTVIGGGAFTGCTSLEEWSISSGHPYFKTDGTGLLTKDGKTLVACLASATEYRIPEGVTEIGYSAFNDCSSLTSVVIPEGVTEIASGAFYGCSSLTSVVIPEGVTEIGEYAFNGCSSLTSVVIPEGVTKIGDWAFSGCSSLTSVVIPEGVTVIGRGAFTGCTSLEEWSISSGHPYFKTDGTGLLTKDGKTLVACLPSAKEYRIPEGVTEIGDRAFAGCSSLTSVVIPKGVTEIGVCAFSDCSSLTSVVIPEGVTEIGGSAFYGCSSLKSVVIHEGVTVIGNWAFHDCRSLTSVVFPEGVTEIGYSAFCDCSSLTSVVIPEGVTEIGDGAFDGCSSLTSVVFPEGVTKIGYSAFSGCSKLTIHTSKGTVVAKYAQNQGIAVQWLEYGYVSNKHGITITKYNWDATEVTIPTEINGKPVTEIGEGAFSGCSSLTSVVIPESVTEIGECAFNGCSSLTSVNIPKSVKEIGNSAFKDCPVPWFSRAWWHKWF